MPNEDRDRDGRLFDDDDERRLGRGLAALAAATVMAGLLMGLLALALSASSRTAQNPLDVERLQEQAVGHLSVPHHIEDAAP